MARVDRRQWDALAQPLKTPLLEWQWLHQLEASGSIAPQTGWYPHHLTLWDDDRMVGAAPLYLKTHSNGEFVFDQWWARWAREAGIAYYPKLVGMSPATPAEGYRFLVDPRQNADAVQRAMLAAIDAACRQGGISGCHLLFVDPAWAGSLPRGRFHQWRHQSFLWRNPGYHTFEDYLQPFKSSQRRNIRRERQSVRKQGIRFRCLDGAEIDPRWADLMFDCYLNTNAQYGPWAARYLNAQFFQGIFTRYRHRLLVVAAFAPEDRDRPVALSLLLHKSGEMIGRYWGSRRTVKDLHFNMCFYEPIEWAIRHHIQTFDPGAGSPHKISRGFAAVANTSLHRFYQPALDALFERFIDGINDVEGANIDGLNDRLPFTEGHRL